MAMKAKPKSQNPTLCTGVGFGDPFQRNLSASVLLTNAPGQCIFCCLFQWVSIAS
jgi:hypothetical protein